MTALPAVILAGAARSDMLWMNLIIAIFRISSAIEVMWQVRAVRRLSSRIEAAINEPFDTLTP